MKHRLNLALAVTAAFLAGTVVAATVPQGNGYVADQPLSAAQLQGDFQAIEARLAALEATTGQLDADHQALATQVASSLSYPKPSDGEVATGATWHDGKPIYRRVVSITSGPNNGGISVPHGASIDTLVRSWGYVSSGGAWNPLPFTHAINGAGGAPWQNIEFSVQPTVVYLESNTNWSTNFGLVVLEYTKP